MLAVESVKASLSQETAWTGEAIPLTITIYSPGPFDGTASFDLPELPFTTILKLGNPVIGSETLDGETWFTQRHEFRLFTQQIGNVVLPPFEVRFAGKKSFTSKPELISGNTSELHFLSKNPPGTVDGEIVTAAIEMQIDQTWQLGNEQSFREGDTVERTIRRQATGTSAMMLPPLSTNTLTGIRIYTMSPVVQDIAERGQSTALRTDTIKYQLQKHGTYELPGLTFTWWDVESETIRTESIPGKTVRVLAFTSNPTGISQRSEHFIRWQWLFGIISIGLMCCIIFTALRRVLEHSRSAWHQPEAIITRQLRLACRSNDAIAAYSALISWKRIHSICDLPPDVVGPFQKEIAMLSTYIFSKQGNSTPWLGDTLWKSFASVRREANRCKIAISSDAILPQLNP